MAARVRPADRPIPTHSAGGWSRRLPGPRPPERPAAAAWRLALPSAPELPPLPDHEARAPGDRRLRPNPLLRFVRNKRIFRDLPAAEREVPMGKEKANATAAAAARCVRCTNPDRPSRRWPCRRPVRRRAPANATRSGRRPSSRWISCSSNRSPGPGLRPPTAAWCEAEPAGDELRRRRRRARPRLRSMPTWQALAPPSTSLRGRCSFAGRRQTTISPCTAIGRHERPGGLVAPSMRRFPDPVGRCFVHRIQRRLREDLDAGSRDGEEPRESPPGLHCRAGRRGPPAAVHPRLRLHAVGYLPDDRRLTRRSRRRSLEIGGEPSAKFSETPPKFSARPPKSSAPRRTFGSPPKSFSSPPNLSALRRTFSSPPNLSAPRQIFQLPAESFGSPPNLSAPPPNLSALRQIFGSPPNLSGPRRTFQLPAESFGSPTNLQLPAESFGSPPNLQLPAETFGSPPNLSAPRRTFQLTAEPFGSPPNLRASAESLESFAQFSALRQTRSAVGTYRDDAGPAAGARRAARRSHDRRQDHPPVGDERHEKAQHTAHDNGWD